MPEPPPSDPRPEASSPDHEALRDTRRHLKAVATVSRALAEARPVAEVFDALAQVVTEMTGRVELTVYRLDTIRRSGVRVYTSGVGLPALERLNERGLAYPALVSRLLSGQESYFEDLTDPATTNIWNATFQAGCPADVRALAELPLRFRGDVRGTLVLSWSAPHAVRAPERDLLRDLAEYAAAALNNADLLERERRQHQLAVAAAEISRRVLERRADLRALRQAVAVLAETVPSDGYALGVVDPTRRSLRYLVATGTCEHVLGTEVSLEQSVLGSATPGTESPEDRMPESSVALRLRVHDQDIGVLWSASTRDGGRTPVDLAALEGLVPSLALAADVVLLNEANDTHHHREHMLAAALNTMEQPVLLLSLDREVRYANPAAVRLFGYEESEFAGITLDELVETAATARRVTAPGPRDAASIWLAEHVHRRKDGSTFPASVYIGYIRDDSQTPLGQVVVVRDLTEERRIAEQLRQSEKLAALGELVAGVAHELNNPLAGISAFAQLLLEDPLDAEQADSVRLIKREADRAVAVIRDLLFFSRKSGPSHGAVDLNEIVEHTLRLRSYGLRSSGIDVRVDLDPSLPQVPGDAQRLHQVVLNLVVNAEHAMQGTDMRRLVVRTEPCPEGVAIVVADTGTGIPEEARLRIFEPFYTTKPEGEGTGLGLSVSYGIVRAHGGNIEVDTRVGAGTSFRVTLPVDARPTASVA